MQLWMMLDVRKFSIEVKPTQIKTNKCEMMVRDSVMILIWASEVLQVSNLLFSVSVVILIRGTELLQIKAFTICEHDKSLQEDFFTQKSLLP